MDDGVRWFMTALRGILYLLFIIFISLMLLLLLLLFMRLAAEAVSGRTACRLFVGKRWRFMASRCSANESILATAGHYCSHVMCDRHLADTAGLERQCTRFVNVDPQFHYQVLRPAACELQTRFCMDDESSSPFGVLSRLELNQIKLLWLRSVR